MKKRLITRSSHNAEQNLQQVKKRLTTSSFHNAEQNNKFNKKYNIQKIKFGILNPNKEVSSILKDT